MPKKITAIELQKKNEERANVYVDDEYAFSCDMELVYKYKLKSGNEIDLDSISQIAEKDDFSKAKNAALRLVERSYKTEKEIVEKLVGKGFNENIIQDVIVFLKEYNFINDDKFAQMYVNDRIKSRGRNKVKFELARKGVDQEVIKDKIGSIDPEEEFNVALKLAEKKYNSLIKRDDDKMKIKQKLFQFLFAKGYSWEICRQVLAKLLKDDSVYD